MPTDRLPDDDRAGGAGSYPRSLETAHGRATEQNERGAFGADPPTGSLGATSRRRLPSATKGKQAILRALEEEASHGHGLFWLAIAFGLGAAFWFGVAFQIHPLPLALAAVAGLGFGLATRGSALSALGFVIGVAALGGLAADLEVRRVDTVLLDSPVTTTVSGTVRAREIDEEGHWRYLVEVTATSDPVLGRPPERVRLLARSDHQPVAIGQGIGGLARLSPPSGPSLPGSFDFAFNSYFAGIGAIGFFMGAPVAEPAAPVTGTRAFGQALRELRESIALRMRTVIGGDAGAVAAAMTVSDRRAISEETDEAFRITGLAHILSISGLHMSLAAGIMFQGLRFALALMPGVCQRHAVKKYAAAGALLSSTAYLMISGGIVSAQRSWIMVAIMLVAVILDRPALTMRNVALAGFAIVALSPSAVVSPGFQMSFAATAALIAAYGFWQRQSLGLTLRRFTGEGLLARGALILGGLALTSLVAGLSTGIFSAHHFHRMSGYGMIANVAAMPIISMVVMPMGVVSLLTMPFGLDYWPLTAMGLGLSAVLAIAHDVAAMGEDFATGRLPIMATALLTAALVILVFTRTRLAALAAVPVLIAVPLIWSGAGAGRPHLLISEDGRLVAMLQADQLATNRSRPPSFVFDQWASALRAETHLAPAEAAPRIDRNLLLAAGMDMALNGAVVRAALDADIAQARADQFICQTGAWCILALSGMPPVVTIEEPAFLGAACDRASIVVIAIPLRLESCRSGAVLYTARTLRRTGAVEIYFDEEPSRSPRTGTAFADEQAAEAGTNGTRGFEAVSAIDSLRRPWTLHRAYDWRSRSFVE